MLLLIIVISGTARFQSVRTVGFQKFNLMGRSGVGLDPV